MVNKTIGFGIIGCGLIASWHADAISGIPGAYIVGAVDVNEKARDAFANKYKVKAFNSADEMLESPDIDVVCICTPSGLHASLAIAVANAGKHIIVEKPMALNLEEADQIIHACEKNKVKMHGHFTIEVF